VSVYSDSHTFEYIFLIASFCVTRVQDTTESIAFGQTYRKLPPSDKQPCR